MHTTKYPNQFTDEDYKTESEELRDQKIESLICAMTWDEKLSLLGGSKEPSDKGKIGNAGYQWGVPRLGVPEIVMYDGPAGITGIVETTGLPQPSLLGCTWDEDMAYAFGQVAAEECASCSGNFLLAPQLDVIRSPHFARNKDMKSEDSYLAARLGVAETRGVQENRVVATIKHFTAANLFGQDFLRFPKQLVDEQTMHETYCRTFDRAIREAGAGSVMNAYNDVNGHYCSANKALLTDILRDQWGFKGSVMSDWGSVHAFTLDKGMDIEMPFPAFNSKERIEKNLRRGRLSESQVEDAVRHVLYSMSTAGLLSLVQLDENGEVMEEPGRIAPIQMQWRYEDEVEGGMLERHGEIAAQIVREGTVLLKNAGGALPLKAEDAGTTVLIGTGAVYPVCGQGQERSFGRLERMLSGREALREAAGHDYAAFAGIDYVGVPIPPEALFQDVDCEKPGLVRSYGILDVDRDPVGACRNPGGGGAAFEGTKQVDEDGEVVDTGLSSYNSATTIYPEDYPLGKVCKVDAQIDFNCGSYEDGRVVRNYRNGPVGTAFKDGETYTWKGFLKAPESGEYDLLLHCVGGEASFFIQTEDGWRMPGKSKMREWAQWPWESLICTPEGMGISGERLTLKAGKAYPVLVHARQCVRNKDLQIRLAWATPSWKRKNYESALAAARRAETVVFFACDGVLDADRLLGVHARRVPIALGGEQLQLLQDVIAARHQNARLIVVVQTSNARAVGGWSDAADAILTAYLPGQEGARAIAELLLGKRNFSGKLSQSWPAQEEDTPLTDTAGHFDERCGGVAYGDGDTLIRMSEGIFTGYRWHDKYGVKALFPFGHGLSYTTFEYSDLSICPLENTWTVRFRVTNTGDMAGDEIVQLYLGKALVPEHIQMAEKQLAGFSRLKNLLPGESREAEITIDPEMLCYWDPVMLLQVRNDGTKDRWVRAVGQRKILVGASSEDIRLTGEINVNGGNAIYTRERI